MLYTALESSGEKLHQNKISSVQDFQSQECALFDVLNECLPLYSFCSLCVFPDQNDTVLVFRGSVYWTVSAEGSVSGPLSLRQRWSDLPPALEAAAFSLLDFKWYFFKGTTSLNSLMYLTFPFKGILLPTG